MVLKNQKIQNKLFDKFQLTYNALPTLIYIIIWSIYSHNNNNYYIYTTVPCAGQVYTTMVRNSVPDSPENINLFELIESRENTGAGDPAQNIGSRPLHERHCSLVAQNLNGAIPRPLVLDSLSGGHHHASSNRVDRVRNETSADCDDVAESKRDSNTSILSQEDWFEGIIETKVATTVDDDTDAGDHKAPVEPSKAVRFESLRVDID